VSLVLGRAGTSPRVWGLTLALMMRAPELP